MQNLLGSHDTARVASHIVNADLIHFREWPGYCERSRGRNSGFRTHAPDAAQRRLQKLAVLFQMTYVGAPMIYYGDEAGMWGATDPCCRKPMVWEDLQHQDEVFLPDGTKRTRPDPVRVDADLLAHYRACIAIRNAHAALQVGSFKTLLADDTRHLYAFERQTPDETVVVILNNGDAHQTCSIPAGKGTWKDVLNTGAVPLKADADGCVRIDLDGRWGRVLVRQK